jgi:hypothetical protein
VVLPVEALMVALTNRPQKPRIKVGPFVLFVCGGAKGRTRPAGNPYG